MIENNHPSYHKDQRFKSSILLFFLVFCAIIGDSQQSTIFHDMSDGLSQNSITSITQDDYGFLWVGTRYGLNKYDGNSYEYFLQDNANPSSLNANTIEKLVTGKNGILWIGTNRGGLNKLHIPTGKITHFSTDNSEIKSNYVRSLYLDEDGYLFISGEKTGIGIMNTSTETFLDAESSSLIRDLSNTDIIVIHGNGKGSMLIGTAKNGVYYYNSITKKLSSHPQIPVMIRSLTHYGDSEFLIGTNQGLYIATVDKNTLTTKKYNLPEINNSVILSILKEEDGTTWIGTENDGLYRLSADSKLERYLSDTSEKSINGNSIWSLYKDSYGIIWTGYYLNGLSKVDKLEEKFNKILSVETQAGRQPLRLVNAFLIDEHQSAWIGLDGGGLIQWDIPSGEYRTIPKLWDETSDKVITALHTQGDKLWIGTWNEGLIVYNTKTGQLTKFTTQKGNLLGNKIHDIIEDGDGRIWVTNHEEGLTVFSKDEESEPYFLEGKDIKEIEDIRVRTIIEDCDKNILIGPERTGLISINMADGNIISAKNLIASSGDLYDDITVNSLLIDAKCNIWVGSAGAGLYCIDYDGSEVQQLTTEDGLRSDMIYALEFDNKGNIWGSTNSGIFSYDVEEKSFTNYTKQDGLVSNEFVLGSSYKSPDGTLYFGGINGINYFNPNNIIKNERPPHVYITNINISDKSYSSVNEIDKPQHYNDASISTEHYQNDISFEYTALNFTQGNLNKFQHILEGFDEDWSSITTDRMAAYANIPYGNYTFRLKATNNDGVWSEVAPSVTLCIKKPWYKTILAYLIYLMILGTIFYLVQKTLLNQVNLRNELDLEHLEVEQLKKIDEVKSKFFANISHEFLTPLTLILTPLKAIKSKGDNHIKEDTIDSMMNNANRLQKFIKQILALSKLESGNIKLRIEEHNMNNWLQVIANNFRSIAVDKSMTFNLDIPDQPITAYYDEDKLEQVIVNLLSNAFKYTDNGGLVTLSLSDNLDSLQIKITDTGYGIAQEDLKNIFNRFYREKNENIIGGTGIGLSITKQILDQHLAEISVISRKGEGSSFIIDLKKGKDHFTDHTSADILNQEKSRLTPSTAYNRTHVSTTIGQITDKPNILVVEDNPDIRTLLADYLSPNYQVYLAEDGIEGVRMASEHMPDLIITDLMMPGKDGYQLIEEVKSNKLTSHIFTIMLTVKSSEESMKQGLKTGADYYITKPFNPELLELRIQNILRYRHGVARSIVEDLEPDLIETSKDPDGLELSDIDKAFVKNLNEIIDTNLGNSDFSVVDLTHELGFSKSQLYRKLKALIGMSANSYIRTKRLQKATELIKTNNYTVAEVTYKVGFNDLQYFRSCFKNAYGVNPSDYQSEHKNQA